MTEKEYGRFTIPDKHNYPPCFLCQKEFIFGDKADLMPIMPTNQAELEKAKAGGQVEAKLVHTTCLRILNWQIEQEAKKKAGKNNE